MNQPEPSHGQGHHLPHTVQYLHILSQVKLSDGDAELTDPNLDHRH